MSRTLLASCLVAGTLLLGASAQVTTADVYMPIANGFTSLQSALQASVVSSVGQTTVYAMSCTDGPCNPVAGGTGTLTFSAAPDTFIYTATFAGGMDYGLECTLMGCPDITKVKCVTSVSVQGEHPTVNMDYPSYTTRMAMSLDHEVAEPTPVECPSTAAPEKTGDAGDGEEEGDGDNSVDTEGADAAKDGEEGKDGEGSAFANAPVLGLLAGAAAGAAAVLL